ncbi:putative acetyl-CoA carboxylase [Lupinus albus]|uniref:Putative acetyl-CoA carboxylase n=1 Tax=Lupinus albus TaxID=3870 RepID=A0A6A4MZ81_LUPAL|nr:putative acetyl-CoA carboxylase [Lupinus albus]
MASCSLRGSNIKLWNLHFHGKGIGLSQQFGIRSWTSMKSLQYTSLVMSLQKVGSLTSASSLEIQPVTRLEGGREEIKSSGLTSDLIPKFKEVEFLLTKLCETSSVGELELKIAGFHLHVVRGLTEKIRMHPPPIPASVSVNTVSEAPKSNGSVSSTSLVISKPIVPSSSGSTQRFLDKAADEGLVIIYSPKVGFFRRSRTIKGKRTPPSCKEKQKVEEGQVICYIEQLGGEVPIESDVSGEVVKILREDGDPVGYGDAVVAILPSFPGIKKLQ